MASKLYIHVDGKNYGPLAPEEVTRWARDGRLTGDDYVWEPEQNQWIRAGDLGFLNAALGKENTTYHVRIGADTIGPMDMDEVVRLINESRFNAMDFIWLEEERRWARAGEVSFLSPYFLKQIREQVEEARLEKELEELEDIGEGAERRERAAALPAWRKEVRRDLSRADDRNYLKTLVTMFLVNILIITTVSFVEVPEPEEVRPAEVLSRVAKLVVDKPIDIPLEEPLVEPEEIISTPGTGAGGGSSGGGGGGGQGGEDYASVGVVGLITSMGSDGSVADLMGSGGDLDIIAGNIAGLKTGGSGTVGRGTGGGFGPGGPGLGLGGGGGTGLGLLAGTAKTVGRTEMKKGRVRVAPPGITGAAASNSLRSSAVIARIVNQRKAGIEYIYKKYLKTNPTMEGKIVVRFTIAASGAVTASSVVSSSLGNPAMEQEVCGRIMTWRFPPIDAGDVTVVYPFVFFSAGA
jgi:TonB family protein